MLETRIRKRCFQIGIPSFKEYREYILSNEGLTHEMDSFIDLVTTNKTDFFREPKHFDYLTAVVLPELCKKTMGREILLWSAASSTGAEPYTLAMVMDDYVLKHSRDTGRFRIIATDISNAVLDVARKGIYPHEEIEPIPLNMRKRYLLKSKKQENNQVRIVKSLRDKVEYRRLNLTKPFRFHSTQDIIFCRNVMIYFDRDTQNQLVKQMVANLRSGGHLFMGHSELLDTSYHKELVSCAPSVYRKLK